MQWHVCVRAVTSPRVFSFNTSRPRLLINACTLNSTWKRGLNGPRYSEDETNRLRELMAQNKSIGDIAEAFPERSFNSLKSRLEKLRKGTTRPSSRKHWSEDEVQRLQNHRLRGTPWPTVAQQFPDRSMSSLETKWRRLAPAQLRKDTRPPKIKAYSEQEEALIKRCMEQGMHWRQVAANFFPDRPPGGIQNKVQRFKEGREWSVDFKWTAEIDQRLKELYDEDGVSFSVIGKILGCPAYAARERHFALNRGKPRTHVWWTEEATQKLLALIQAGRSLDDMVQAFPNKTYGAVRDKVGKLRRHYGIPASRKRRSL